MTANSVSTLITSSYGKHSSAMEGAKAIVPSLKTAYKDVKKVVSVKTTVSRPERRLPPIGLSGSNNSNAGSGALPPLSGALPPLSGTVTQSSVLPSVTRNGTNPPVTRTADVSRNEGEGKMLANTSASQGNAASSTRVETGNGEEPLPSYAALFGADTSSTSSAVNNNTSAAANGIQSVVSRDNPFITSQLPAPQTQQTSLTPGGRSNADQPQSQADKIKRSGIRTWPILAVCSVFICCPIFGLAAAMLTLSAENKFYDRQYVKAHKEAFTARICLLLAVVFGLITIVTVISYLFAVLY